MPVKIHHPPYPLLATPHASQVFKQQQYFTLQHRVLIDRTDNLSAMHPFSLAPLRLLPRRLSAGPHTSLYSTPSAAAPALSGPTPLHHYTITPFHHSDPSPLSLPTFHETPAPSLSLSHY